MSYLPGTASLIEEIDSTGSLYLLGRPNYVEGLQFWCCSFYLFSIIIQSYRRSDWNCTKIDAVRSDV